MNDDRIPPLMLATSARATTSTPTISGELQFTVGASRYLGYVNIRTARNDDAARFNESVASLMFTGEHAADDMRAAAAVLIAEADAADALAADQAFDAEAAQSVPTTTGGTELPTDTAQEG